MLSLGEDVETVAEVYVMLESTAASVTRPKQSWSPAEPCAEGADVVSARTRLAEQRGLIQEVHV